MKSNCLGIALALLGLVACSGTAQKPLGDVDSGQTLVYECSDFEFIARTGPGEIALYLPDDYRVLGQVRTGSGLKYADADVTLSSKGEEASLDVGGRHYRDCRLNRARAPWEEARRRGVDFRAVGQEPGWYLEIQQGKQMLLVSGYGQNRTLFATPEPQMVEGVTVYQVRDGAHELRVEVSVEHCRDTMSGEVFENSVRITLDEHIYLDCGIALEPNWE